MSYDAEAWTVKRFCEKTNYQKEVDKGRLNKKRQSIVQYRLHGMRKLNRRRRIRIMNIMVAVMVVVVILLMMTMIMVMTWWWSLRGGIGERR